jgi:hypothetical protein
MPLVEMAEDVSLIGASIGFGDDTIAYRAANINIGCRICEDGFGS